MERVERAHLCPHCEKLAVHPPAVRQGVGVMLGVEVGIVDVGYRCARCGQEWGFELLGREHMDTVPKVEKS